MEPQYEGPPDIALSIASIFLSILLIVDSDSETAVVARAWPEAWIVDAACNGARPWAGGLAAVVVAFPDLDIRKEIIKSSVC